MNDEQRDEWRDDDGFLLGCGCGLGFFGFVLGFAVALYLGSIFS